MIKIGDKEYRNLQEQVEKNKNDILFILQEEGVLNEFGIKVIGQEESLDDLPSVADYKEEHTDWAYGDAYAIGTEAPFELYVLTRANGTHPSDYWFNIGEFPMPGPQGEQGEQGIQGETGATGSTGATGAQGPQGPRGYSIYALSKNLSNTIGSYNETNKDGIDYIVGDVIIGQNGYIGKVTSVGGSTIIYQVMASIVGPAGQRGQQGEQGPQGIQGPAGQDGADGTDGTDGQDGVTPDITVEASVGSNVGTPTVTVTKSGTDAEPVFTFAFDGVKGPQGETGQTGATGATGPVPVVSAVATVDAQVGTPTVTVTKSGTDASPTFTFAFSNIKGDTGTSLISVEVVSTLPASGTSGTLYFVPNGSASGTDLYNEYIWLNNSWELLGTASVDLSNYIQKSLTSGLVKNDGTIDTNTYALASALANYVLSSSLATVATSGDYDDLINKPTLPSNYVTTDTAQTITANKSFSGKIILLDNQGNNVGEIYGYANGMVLGQDDVWFANDIKLNSDNSQSIGQSNKRVANINVVKLSNGSENYNYGIQVPDTSQFTANKTLATTDQIGAYVTTAPSADNADGTLKIVVLSSEPATYYNGYIYYITEA